MRHLLFTICTLTALISCKNKKDTLNYETNIASLTYRSEMEYLNNTLKDYSNLSDIGKYYLEQDSILEAKALTLKNTFRNEDKISIQDQNEFLNFFKSSFKGNAVFLDSTRFDELKNTPITTISDIDLLVLLVKRSFVSNLVANKFYTFNMVGTMATVDNWGIKNGEDFKMQLNITAANTIEPAEWYVLKDGGDDLTKENISDTLHPDESGTVNYTTRKYHMGTNQIYIGTKFKSAHGEKILYKLIEYTVH